MPPRTRRVRGTAPGNQATLSFNNASKITKSGANDAAAAKAASKAAQIEAAQVEEVPAPQVEPDSADVKAGTPEPDITEVEVEVAIRESPRKQAGAAKKRATKTASEKDAREAAAEKVTDAQLKKYWQAEEDARLAPRVHQASLSLHEKILRHFDLSSQFGPCIGIPRLQRWQRANGLGLEPPIEVLAVLLREEDKKTSQGCGRLAYIDELGGGRIGIVE